MERTENPPIPGVVTGRRHRSYSGGRNNLPADGTSRGSYRPSRVVSEVRTGNSGTNRTNSREIEIDIGSSMRAVLAILLIVFATFMADGVLADAGFEDDGVSLTAPQEPHAAAFCMDDMEDSDPHALPVHPDLRVCPMAEHLAPAAISIDTHSPPNLHRPPPVA